MRILYLVQHTNKDCMCLTAIVCPIYNVHYDLSTAVGTCTLSDPSDHTQADWPCWVSNPFVISEIWGLLDVIIWLDIHFDLRLNCAHCQTGIVYKLCMLLCYQLLCSSSTCVMVWCTVGLIKKQNKTKHTFWQYLLIKGACIKIFGKWIFLKQADMVIFPTISHPKGKNCFSFASNFRKPCLCYRPILWTNFYHTTIGLNDS